MTTSKQPWSTRPSTQGDGQGAEVLDVCGNIIAFFKDHRDASLCVTTVGAEEEMERLRDRIDDHKGEIDYLRSEIRDVREELNSKGDGE